MVSFTCRNVAREIALYDLDSQQILMQLTVSKAIVVAQKLESDSLTRFRDTLKVLQGCRLLGYQFVKNTTLGFVMGGPSGGDTTTPFRMVQRSC